jgi:hypothetical protein
MSWDYEGTLAGGRVICDSSVAYHPAAGPVDHVELCELRSTATATLVDSSSACGGLIVYITNIRYCRVVVNVLGDFKLAFTSVLFF